MKKRLLITSIVMMLVVAVALSTATYAWFTSNANVTASTVNITAATNEAEALGIGWEDGTASTFIVANDAASALNPMVPAFLLNDTTTDAVTFYSATVKSEASVEVFNNDVSSTIVPYTFTNGTKSAFYIKNLSKANTVSNVNVTASFSTGYELTEDTTFKSGTTYYTKNAKGFYEEATVTVGESVTASTYYVVSDKDDGSGLIRIAIFTKANGESNYTLKGVISKNPAANDTVIANATNAAAGTLKVFANGPTADCGKITSVSNVNLLSSGNLAANNETLTNGASKVDVVVKVWYDGVALNDETAGSMASISLTFSAVSA